MAKSNKNPIDWECKAGILWPELVGLAKRNEIITYGGLAEQAKTNKENLTARNIGNALEPIQNFCLDRGDRYPILTAIVVRKASGRPGKGFEWDAVGNTEDGWRKERDDVFDFEWGKVGNPFVIDIYKFINFVRVLDGQTLKTDSQGKLFRVDIDAYHIIFTPASTDNPRKLKFTNMETYLKFYNQGCRATADYSRINKTGDGKKLMNASYFLAVMAEYEKPQNKILHEPDDTVDNNKATEKDAITKARVGQGKFREMLLKYWDGACSVTKIGNKQLLIASHIKPWKDSDHNERLDKFNGLLLTPNLDALFDGGLITFGDDRKIIISSRISNSDLEKLGVNRSMRLHKIDQKHKPFLAYHRENVFVKK